VTIFEEKDGRPLAEHLRSELDKLSLAISGAAAYPGSRIPNASEVGLIDNVEGIVKT
jgi:hypothetical protein